MGRLSIHSFRVITLLLLSGIVYASNNSQLGLAQKNSLSLHKGVSFSVSDFDRMQRCDSNTFGTFCQENNNFLIDRLQDCPVPSPSPALKNCPFPTPSPAKEVCPVPTPSPQKNSETLGSIPPVESSNDLDASYRVFSPKTNCWTSDSNVFPSEPIQSKKNESGLSVPSNTVKNVLFTIHKKRSKARVRSNRQLIRGRDSICIAHKRRR